MRLRAPLASAILVSGGLLSGACAPNPDELPPSIKSMVNATAVISACPDNKRMNGKLAFEAINRLVEPCAQVPGGKAHFAATLLPGGRIELASPEGSVAEGVVPTCVLRHGLTHRVLLAHRCTFDVQLEERRAGAPSGS